MERMDVVCFGGGDWWYHNRGHMDMQIMRRFAKLGTTLYINSIVVQKPRLGQGKKFLEKLVRKTRSILRGLKQSTEGFWVYSPVSLPANHIAWAAPLNTTLLRLQLSWVTHRLRMRNPVVWLTCPAATDIAIKMKKSKMVYQRADIWEEYPNVDTKIVSRCDRRAKANADLTIFVSRILYDREADQCKRALYLDHGVDFELFSAAGHKNGSPADVKDLPRPIAGFFGGIDDHTCDIAFMENVVDLLPQMTFVFVGKTSSNITSLQKRRNVWLLGQKPYELIPYYGKCFDVAIMPWHQNRWIEACNPVKLKEYLALGKPVVSTPFPELQKYRDVVYQASTPKEFAKYLTKALSEDKPERVAARKKKVQTSTWDSKAKLVLEALFTERCHQ